jgi:23S rRNA (cytidine1920-2'-O)/16S rRNA (cytidine1409-2'-O)-methyltransferase
MAQKKIRLDQLVHTRYPELSKTYIQSLIMQGKLSMNGLKMVKPGMQVAQDIAIELDLEAPKYVSRAGLKLEKALEHFGIDVNGLVVLDAGLSTGGFTDCLLQHGTKKVYGIDVGYGQVHDKIRKDSRVVVIERTNLRSLASLPELVDLVTLDLSFISVLKIMDTVCRVLKPDGQLVVLIKPQFEAEKGTVGKGGIIRDAVLHDKIINKVTAGIQERGFTLMGITESPIEGMMGNKEFLAYFKRKKT